MIGQVPKLFGVEKSGGNFFEQAWGVITRLGDTQWRTLLIGVLSLAVVLGFKRWLPLVPGSLLAVLVGIGAVSLLGLDDKGVEHRRSTSTPACLPWACRTVSGSTTTSTCSVRRWGCC